MQKMVYTLLCLAVKRNLKFSSKTLQQADFILQKRFPSQILSFMSFSTSAPKQEKKSFDDGKYHIDSIINQAKKGKISITDISTLAQRVISEGQYSNYKSAPQTVQMISFSGLVPMLGIPVLALLSGHASYSCVHAHLACGATILSFLGGSNWNEAITSNNVSYGKLGWCITPQIIGWTSMLLPIPLGMMLASVGFCLSLIHDVLLSNYPQWMKSLRLVLTGGILMSFLLMLIIYIIL